MLYERAIRDLFERSLNSLHHTLDTISGYMSDSLSDGSAPDCLKQSEYQTSEAELLRLLVDPVLAKRIELKGF